jgi:hypothetical protein
MRYTIPRQFVLIAVMKRVESQSSMIEVLENVNVKWRRNMERFGQIKESLKRRILDVKKRGCFDLVLILTYI